MAVLAATAPFRPTFIPLPEANTDAEGAGLDIEAFAK